MTTYTIENNNKNYKIIIQGHSEYAEKGEDIVCASISTSQYLIIQLAYELDCLIYHNVVENLPLVEIAIKKNKIGKRIVNTFDEFMKELKRQFPDYVKEEK